MATINMTLSPEIDKNTQQQSIFQFALSYSYPWFLIHSDVGMEPPKFLVAAVGYTL